MERVHYRDLDDLQVLDITDQPKGPENLLLGLQRYPNLRVNRIPVFTDAPDTLRNETTAIRGEIGRTPLALVLCHAGIYRSYLIAAWLVDNNLATLCSPNLDSKKGDVAGAGCDYLDLYGLGIDERGISIDPRTTSSADMIILNLAVTKGRQGDRSTLTRFSLIMERLLEKGPELKRTLPILWLEGIEDDFQKYFKTA